MAHLDVADVLDDPDFCDDGLICERSAESVDDYGRAAFATTQTSFSGVVVSDRGDLLTLVAEASYVQGSILIYTRFSLTEGDDATTADTVIWKFRRFTVKNVYDYSHFGAGFVGALCEPQKPSGA